MPSPNRPPERPSGLQARGLSWRRRARGPWVALWVARRDLVDKGYRPASARLWPPTDGLVGAHPTPTEWLWIAAECERRQNEMHGWCRSEHDSNPLLRYNGTIKTLIDVYQLDKDSPYHALRWRTRLRYDSNLRILTKAVGAARIAQLTFRDFKRWHEGFRGDKKDRAGRTIEVGHMVERAHGLMTKIRILLGFGALARLPGCKEAREVLSEEKFACGKRRKQYMTAAHAIAIRKKAHEMGRPSIALAQALMFELGLRQKDVIGEWIPMDEPGLSAITHHGRKWMIGIDWREIDENLILRHRLSKSVYGRLGLIDGEAGQIEEFDLREFPMVMEELRLSDKIGNVPPSGPLVVQEGIGRPWRQEWFTQKWREVADAAGLPKEVQSRDSRAGAATESSKVAKDPEQVKNMLGHSNVVMTERYIRERRDQRSELQRERVKRRETE